MTDILLLFILLPLGAAFLMLMLGRLNYRLADLAAVLVSFSLLAVAVALYFIQPAGALVSGRLGGWALPLGINLVLDGLSHLLLLAVSLVAALVIFYSVSYMEKYTAKGHFYALFMLMLAGMNAVVLTGDLFTMFLALELAALASAALVAFGTGAEELEAAFKYLIMGTVASIFILFAIALVYKLTGTLNLAVAALSLSASQSRIKLLIMALFLLGFGTKTALIPFHAWLPDAHPAAPAPVSATLSGVLIKALGVYALIRIFYNVLGITPEISFLLALLGAISILGGAFMALGQDDLKRLLACSSISQVGYIVLGVGLATPLGIMGGLFHLLNHAIYKPLLFLNAGALEYSTGTRKLSELGGLRQKMPVTANSGLLASLSIAGVPPFNGFWSKLFIILACVFAGKIWFALAAVAGSILTMVYIFRVQREVFFSELPAKLKEVKEVPWLMGSSMLALSLLCLGIGLLFPYALDHIINPAVNAVLNGTNYGRLVIGGQ